MKIFPAATAPLTEAQEGLWYFQAMDPKNPILNTGQYLELTGTLDRGALAEAVLRTVTEAGALRLRFGMAESGPVQWQSDDLPQLLELDLSAHADPEGEALRRMEADTTRAIDLAHEPNAAFTLFKLATDRHFLYERIHHLATDGYGMVLVTNRIAEHYNCLTQGKPAPLAFRPITTADEEDRAYRNSDKRAEDARWWRESLANLPEVIGPAPGRAVSGATFLRHSGWIDTDVLARLTAFSDANRLNWTDVLTGVLGAYLARWTGGEITVGLPFMARMGRKIARLPCMAMNVLPQRILPDEDMPLAAWLQQLTLQMREGRKHGLYRSEQLRRDLGLVGGTRRLYGPLINLQPFDRPPQFAGLSTKLHILGAGAVDDLTLTFRGDTETGMLFEVDANPALYSREDIEAHHARAMEFLAGVLRHEDFRPVPTATLAEIAEIDARNAATAHPVPDTTLTALIEAQMRATPEAPALRFGTERLSYAELDARSRALAEQLVALGAGPGKIVAVLMERSSELSIALLAVLRAGAAYLPMDPEHPKDRLSRILDLSQPLCVLTDAHLATHLPQGAPVVQIADWRSQPEGAALPQAQPSDMAYIIFTSGSTGEPKGVVIEHRAIVNRLIWMRDFYGFGPQDRILQKTPATFDVSVWEFFLSYISGGELVMAAPGLHRDPTALAGAIRENAITTLHFVPSMLSAFLAAPAAQGLQIARVFCSGEELTPEHRARFHTRITGELHNLYGPTEAAVDVSYWPATPEDHSAPLPIGYPVWNTALLVLDDHMRPVPAGLAGHLYLGGVQLARGYLGRPDLTEARFIPHPYVAGARLYATGDLARLRADGAVVYLGRSDHQVKIRGLRIELGEIEAAIMDTGLAAETVVLAREDHAGEKRLVSYIVPTADYRSGLVAERLAARLPAYMVPSAEVVLDKLPVTSNGKLDRKALPAPEFRDEGRAADTATERLLVRLFTEILHLPEAPSAEADFFGLGGDSLSAVRLALRIGEELGEDPGIGAVFEYPTIATLAQVIDGALVTSSGLSPLLLLAEGDTSRPPVVLLHPAGGLGWGYRRLAHALAPRRRVYALQHPGFENPDLPPQSLRSLSLDYLKRLEALDTPGPVHLVGWSVGGLLAQDMAAQMQIAGKETGVVVVLDSYPADLWRNEPEPDPVAALRALLAIAGHDPEGHPHLDTREKVAEFLKQGDTALGRLPSRVLDAVVRVVTDTNRMVRSHFHSVSGPIVHIRAGNDHKDRDLVAEDWVDYVETVEALSVPYLHAQMISREAVADIAPLLTERFDTHDAGRYPPRLTR